MQVDKVDVSISMDTDLADLVATEPSLSERLLWHVVDSGSITALARPAAVDDPDPASLWFVGGPTDSRPDDIARWGYGVKGDNHTLACTVFEALIGLASIEIDNESGATAMPGMEFAELDRVQQIDFLRQQFLTRS